MQGIVANSFPKSGTHVLTQILELLRYKQADTHLSRSLIMYGPRNVWRNIKISQRLARPQNGLSIDIENPKRLIKPIWLNKHLDKFLSEKSYSQAHLPFTSELEQFFFKKNTKMLYIHRDPMDVLVSLKNYILKLSHHPNHKMLSVLPNDEERFLLLLHGYKHGTNIDQMAPFFEKYNSSIKWRDSEACCCIQFENIIGPKGGGSYEKQYAELEKIRSYLNLSAETVKNIQNKIFNPNSETFHKGQIGQWRRELSPKIIDLCEQQLSANQNELKHSSK